MKILGHTLSDFLMFSQEIYRNQIETLNALVWPGQFIFAAAAILLASAVFLNFEHQRIISIVLAAVSWLTSAVLFHYVAYSPVNWLAVVYTIAFILQSVLMLLLLRLQPRDRSDLFSKGAAAICLAYALVIHPALTAALYGYSAIELWGLHPTPTIIASLSVLIIYGRASLLFLFIPLIYALVEGLLAWELQIFEVIAIPAACFLIFFTLLCRKYARI